MNVLGVGKDKNRDKNVEKKKDKEKEKEKEKKSKDMKTLHKHSLKKWLIKSKSNKHIFDSFQTKEDDNHDGSPSAGRKGDTNNKDKKKDDDDDLDSDGSDSSDDDTDIDDDKVDSLIKTQDSHPLTPKEVSEIVYNRLKERNQEPIHFTSLDEINNVVETDTNHFIIIIHCVDWFNISRTTHDNFKKELGKEKDIILYFVNQSSPEYSKENQLDYAGIPITRIIYKQRPLFISRTCLEYDWKDEERIRGIVTTQQIQELLSELRDSKKQYDSLLMQEPMSILELKLDF